MASLADRAWPNARFPPVAEACRDSMSNIDKPLAVWWYDAPIADRNGCRRLRDFSPSCALPPPEREFVLFRNHTLAAMQADDIAAILPHLSRLDVERGTVLTDQGAGIDLVYFPTTAYLSNAVMFSDGRSAQTFIMGVEGVSGLAAFLAEAPSAWGIEVRSSGEVYHLPAAVLRRQVEVSPGLRQQLLRLTHDYQAQAAYSVACASLHTLVSRLAHFILTSADRRGDDLLHLTQQDVADFLGSQRTTVNSAATDLKEAKAIKYSRGVIRIIDRDALRRHACECYQFKKSAGA